jgi:LuxR family maltose regulon positive regulatory protein
LLPDLGASPISVISAARGFGKSTLLRQWREALTQDPASAWDVVWIAVATPLDGSGFWREVLTALSSAPAAEPGVEREMATATLRRIGATRPTALLIDGLERVSDEAVPEELAALVSSGAVGRLAVSTRHYSRACQEAFAPHSTLVLHADDLAFTASEVDALRQEAAPDSPPVDDILGTTGGWPVLVRTYLAARNRWGTAEAADAQVRDTLATLLSATSSDAPAAELTHAGVLALSEDLTEEFAAELSGDPEVGRRLERLANEGLLVEEPSTGLLRWPTAVRTALVRSPLPPASHLDQLHSRIGRWYLRRDDPVSALRHATLAEDWALVTSILDNHSRTLLFAHTYTDLYTALHRIPLTHVATSPVVIGLRDIWLRVPDAMLADATRLPESAAALDDLGRSPRARPTLEAGYLLAMAISRRGLSDRAREYGSRLLRIVDAARASRPEEILELYPSLHLHVGILHLVGGDYTAGLTSLWRAYERADDNPRPYIRADAASKTALAYAVMGDHARTSVWLERFAAAPLHSPQYEARIRCTADAARVLIATDQLQLSAAREANARLLVADTYGEEIFWAHLAYAEAQYALAVGTPEDMLEHLSRLESHYEHWIGNGAIAGPLIAATRADLLMALGRGNRAKDILEGPHADHPLLQVGRARLAMAAGQPEAALRFAADATWTESATPRQRLDMQLIQAVAAHRVGDHELARTALRRATDAAGQSGSLKPFRTVPEADLRQIAEDLPATQTLLDHASLTQIGEQFPSAISLITLTPRESEVLARLATPLSLQQIAISLHLSHNTVKVHVRTLYAKLGVASREDAIAEARRHGLL